MKTIKVDKVILYYMDRVDPDGNLYRFYVYKDMASEIEYFCTEETGNMTIPIGEGKYIEIVPREIVKIPVRGYRRLAGKWNCETCNGKGWYRLFNYFKYKPDICYIKNIGRDKNGNTRYEISLFRIVRWDYNRCFKDESLDKDLFMGKYGKVMGEHYYNKFIHEFDGNILKMIGYFRGSEKEGQVFCDMITERIEKYEKRMSYDKGKLNN